MKGNEGQHRGDNDGKIEAWTEEAWELTRNSLLKPHGTMYNQVDSAREPIGLPWIHEGRDGERQTEREEEEVN